MNRCLLLTAIKTIDSPNTHTLRSWCWLLQQFVSVVTQAEASCLLYVLVLVFANRDTDEWWFGKDAIKSLSRSHSHYRLLPLSLFYQTQFSNVWLAISHYYHHHHQHISSQNDRFGAVDICSKHAGNNTKCTRAIEICCCCSIYKRRSDLTTEPSWRRFVLLLCSFIRCFHIKRRSRM